jgi:hypothetical protein
LRSRSASATTTDEPTRRAPRCQAFKTKKLAEAAEMRAALAAGADLREKSGKGGNKFDVKFVMEQVGHADSKMTTDVYNQLQQRARREHGEAFDRLVRSARERLYGADPDDETATEERSIRTRIRTRERKKTFEDVVDEWRDEDKRP